MAASPDPFQPLLDDHEEFLEKLNELEAVLDGHAGRNPRNGDKPFSGPRRAEGSGPALPPGAGPPGEGGVQRIFRTS